MLIELDFEILAIEPMMIIYLIEYFMFFELFAKKRIDFLLVKNNSNTIAVKSFMSNLDFIFLFVFFDVKLKFKYKFIILKNHDNIHITV